MLVAPEHQEMNIQVKVTWRTFRTIAHSLIVHARVLEAYIHFVLMYTTDHIYGSINQRFDKQRQQSNHAI